MGGATARAVGERLRAVAAGRQVLCVTHLPQIAGLADVQYTVAKSASGERTRIRVERLAGAARAAEIARMLGGDPGSETARRHAAELLRGGRGR